MNKIFVFIVASMFFVSLPLIAQNKSGAASAAKGGGTEGVVKGGVGMTWIDGDAYYLIGFQPEIAFGKIGVGLDINVYVSSKDQSIRWQELQRGRFIRYLRYGNKGDEFYIRLGMLDYSRLGHGFILYNYKNSPSVDNRRIGTELDVDFGTWGLETVYSDVTAIGVLGARGFVRPLQFTPAKDIPVIGNLEIGATIASDVRKDSRDIKIDTTGGVTKKNNTGSLSVVGLDLGLPLLRLPVVDLTYYVDYAKIVNYGHGFATGIEANFSALGVLKIFTKFERRFGETDQFIPAYFDAFYELERYQINKNSLKQDTLSSKAKTLANTISQGPGFFGSLLVDVLGTIQMEGSYQKLDRNPTSGILHLGTNTGDKIPLIMVSAGYDKRNIQNNKDVFTLDERSLLYAEVGYKPYPFMIVSTLYTWTFAPEKDNNGNVTGYKPQKRITPKVSFVFPL
jgi:hypothetical protein